MKKITLVTLAVLLTACHTISKDNNNIMSQQDLFGKWQCSTTKSLYDRNEELFTFYKNGSYDMEGANMHADILKLNTSSQGLWTLYGNELTIISQKGTVVRNHTTKGQTLLKKDKQLAEGEELALVSLQLHLNSGIPSSLTIFGKGNDPKNGSNYILMRPTQERYEVVIRCNKKS